MLGRTIFLATTLVSISSLSFADHSHEDKKASEAYNSGDYQTAFNIWLVEAENGEMTAQSTIGAMYAYGKGTKQNYSEAARWYLMAAEQGNLNSQFSLASLYRQGLGVSQSNQLA